MMPHPERAADAAHGGTDGQAFFKSVFGAVIGSMQTA
jgi:phosphoribosylformylglycinamidine synthase